MEILELEQKDHQMWDQYVKDSSQSSVYHLIGWKYIMESCFGHKTHYLIAKEQDQIIGILPLIYVHSILTGHFFTSMPGGLCARDVLVAAGLIDQVKHLMIDSGAKYLILRDSPQKWDLPGLITNTAHCTLSVKLSDDNANVWRGVKKRARQLTNQAYQAGLEAISGVNSFDFLYPVYSEAMREKGTPTLGKNFFKNLAIRIPDHFNLIMVKMSGKILGGGFLAPFKDTLYCTWGGMLHQYYDLHPNHILFWETLKYGCSNGYQQVDLGRSQVGSGSYHFKMNWGAEELPLYQQYYLNGITNVPVVGKSMEEGFNYRLFVKIWRKIPLPIAELIGPQLRKRMPFG